METGTLLAIIGLVATLIGFFLAKKIIKSKKDQRNKIVIKTKGNATFRDIIGGDKTTHGNTEFRK